MYPTTLFKDYEISWQEPPATSAGYDMTISSSDADLQTRLEQSVGRQGTLPFSGTWAKLQMHTMKGSPDSR